MSLHEMIYKRKSTRSFTDVPVNEETLSKIRTFCSEARSLYPEIKVIAEIVSKDTVKCLCPWTTPQMIAVFSENKEGFLENAGFIYQQLDLYLQSIGLGVCWLGMGKLTPDAIENSDGLKFVILLAFGHPKTEVLRNDTKQFKRKALSQISDRTDERLEPARLAPSSVNSQPWYFVHDGDAIHVYCTKQGLLRKLGDMNRIDIGISLAHMYIANPNTYRFFTSDNVTEINGYGYIGSFCI